MDVFTPILDIIGPLHPALSLIHSLYNVCQKVRLHTNQCKGVAQRAGAILDAINGQLSLVRKLDSPEVLRNIQVLQSELVRMLDKMTGYASWNRVKCLTRLSEIDEEIQTSHRSLNDVCNKFLISAMVQVQYSLQAAEAARRQDAKAIEMMAARAAVRDAELLMVLEIGQNQQLEAMLAIQRALQRLTVESPERKLLSLGVSALQRSTGQLPPPQLPPWHITPYELDIDEDFKLGQGGFGVVKKATHLGRTVAVKLLESGTSREKLLSEITVWDKLRRHEHVLQMFGACDTADPPFIVSMYMKNGNAVEYLRRNPTTNRVLLVHQVALGMTYLHHENVIHGDLKGANILIDDAGKACIADFGLSKIRLEYQSRASTKPTDATGTLRFMAPEQIKGKMALASDVYSYGMLIYQFFTDEIPFQTVPDQAIFHGIVGVQDLEKPEGDKAAARGLTNAMWDLLIRCSAPLSAQRPIFEEIHPKTQNMVEQWNLHVQAERGGATAIPLSPPIARSSTNEETSRTVRAKDGGERGGVMNSFLGVLGKKGSQKRAVRPAQSSPAPQEPAHVQPSRKIAPPSREQRTYTVHRLPLVLRGHTSWVSSVAISGDGRSVVSGSLDGTVGIWDAFSGRRTHTLKKDSMEFNGIVAISADGGLIVSGSRHPSFSGISVRMLESDCVRMWDAKSCKPLLSPMAGHTRYIRGLAISRDGSLIASSSEDSSVRIWNTRTGALALPAFAIDGYSKNSVAFFPDGNRIVVASADECLHVWDIRTRMRVLQPIRGHQEGISGVAVSMDGTFMASTSYDRTVRLWDAHRGTSIGEPFIGHTESVESVAISSDGRSVVSGSWDETFRLWDARTGKLALAPVNAHEYCVGSVAISNDGKRVVTAGHDNDVRIWELAGLSSSQS